jgi:hypothetical protein
MTPTYKKQMEKEEKIWASCMWCAVSMLSKKEKKKEKKTNRKKKYCMCCAVSMLSEERSEATQMATLPS